MTVGSLFSGIGGFDLGFERAGFEIKWQVEIDPFCRAVLAKHWPEVTRYFDVRKLKRPPAVDVLCGGFPCQPHSLAGRRGGSADERDLWPEFARIIREIRPRWVVAENVPGLLSSDAGRFFGTVLGDLAACGYDAEWDCLPASAFGAPHRRDRVWIVAYPNEQRCVERWLSEGQGQSDLSDAAGRGRERTDSEREDSRRILADAGGAGLEERSVFSGVRSEANGAFSRQAAVSDGSMANAGCSSSWSGYRLGKDNARIWNEGTTDTRECCCEFGRSWRVEPDVGRVAHGIPAQVDRLRGLGNAIVPQIAQWIAERIKEAEAA